MLAEDRVQVVEVTSEELKRPALITLMAVLQWVGALFWFALTVSITLGILSLHAPFVLAALTLTLGAISVPLQVVCGIGLWTLQPWGRTLQMALAAVGLLAFPPGTLVAILMLLYLNTPGIKVLFSGKPASSRTPLEQQFVADVMRPARSTTVLGVIGTTLVVLVWIIGGIFAQIPLRSARRTANEHAAINALRDLQKAETEYAGDCGRGGYATSFDVLRTVIPDASVPASQGFGGSSRGIAGYWITLRQGATAASGPVDCHGVPTVTGWYASATPQTFGSTGTKSFAINDAGVVWQTLNDAPPMDPFGPPATVAGR